MSVFNTNIAVSVTKKPHHEPTGKCYTRAKYRQGREDTAVKVFTVSQESYFLLVKNVPSVGVHPELKALCEKFGRVESCQPVNNYPSPEFTQTFLIKYNKLQEARTAKKQLDERSFFGAILQACYAPELETISMTRKKLKERKLMVAARIRHLNNSESSKEIIKPDQIPLRKIEEHMKIGKPTPVASKEEKIMPKVSETVTYIWAGQEYTVPFTSKNNESDLRKYKNCSKLYRGVAVTGPTCFKPRQIVVRESASSSSCSPSYEDTRKRVRAKLGAFKCSNPEVNVIRKKKMKPEADDSNKNSAIPAD